MTSITRRDFLAGTATAFGVGGLSTATPGSRKVAAEPAASTDEGSNGGQVIIDAHTHFYDPGRPEGVPWPAPGGPLYRQVLPRHYRAERTPQPVTGTIVIEASEWVEDNQWILDLAKDDPFIVGFVGRLPVGDERFPKLLERFGGNPLFRGIRIQSRDIAAALDERPIERQLALLAERDLSLDVLGDVRGLARVPELAKRLPRLRIVVDHMGNPVLEGKPTESWRAWCDWLSKFEPLENVSCKVSALVGSASHGRKRGTSPTDVAFYAPSLDHVWRVFGEDRVIYGSDWPVSEVGADLFAVQKLATEYFATKGTGALAKYLAGNARTIYKWIERTG